MVVARQEHVTLPDTETHSRLEIETLLFNGRHAIRSLNFAAARRLRTWEYYVCVFRVTLVCGLIMIRILRGRRGKACVEMRPEGSVPWTALAEYLAP